MSQNPRTDEIRTPLTIKEADSAIDFAEEVLKSIDGDIHDRERCFDSPLDEKEWLARIRAARKRWEVKRRQLTYYRARIEAGEPPVDIEITRLKEVISQKEQQIYGLHQQLAELRGRQRAASTESQAANGTDGSGNP